MTKRSQKNSVKTNGLSLNNSMFEFEDKSKYNILKKGKGIKTVQVGTETIGGENLVIIAGPCVVENESQLMEIAWKLKELDIKIMRASLFKPRTSPYSYQGLGLNGLSILKKVRQETGILLESEIVNICDLEVMVENLDIIRIGSRNMHNYELLKAVGKIEKPVILKRGFSSTIREFILSAEYILSGGNEKVILCERGIRTFETAYRNTLDLGAVDILKKETGLPVIVDPSHAAGHRDLVPALSRAAIAAGSDGLIIEMHPDPENALSDGPQSLYPHQLDILIREVKIIHSCLRNKNI